MTLLFVGIVVFFGIHLMPMVAGVRQAMVHHFGEPMYKTTFAILSAMGLVMLMMGKGNAEFIPLWPPPAGGGMVAKILMLPAIVLFVATFVPNNIRRIVKHPMLLGTILWAVAHLLTNGDTASILLFGSFCLYGVVDYLAVSRRPAETIAVTPKLRDLVVFVIGIVVYVLVYKIHPVAFAPL